MAIYDLKTDHSTLAEEEPTAIIHIGSWHIQIFNKTFTKEQIKNMREFFG